ncbi:MAG: MFS transporter [Chloroflexi bacterium]|nr:MFS transporter [Chloroflexota bacterium]
MDRRLVLLWVTGAAARVSLLAVPPLIPEMHRDLDLAETAVGALTGLPVLLLSIGGLVGSLVIARVGPRRAAIAGLAVIAVAGALRGVGPSVAGLFAMTIVMAAGVALTQLAIPPLVAVWEPHNVGRATAVYSNGMLAGEIAGAALTGTVVLALVGGSWERALAAWSILVVAVAVALVRGPEVVHARAAAAWWPDWTDGRMWIVGLTLASASIAYWGGNAHVPDYLHALGRGDDVAVALASLNGFQVPASLLVAVWPGLFVARRWPLVAAGIVALAAAVGLVLVPAANAAWTGAIGFVAAFGFVLALALPPLLAPPNEVHRFAAGVFAIGFGSAFAAAVIAGALWDATGIPTMALFPVVVAGVLMLVLGSRLSLTTTPTRPLQAAMAQHRTG